MNPGFGKLFDYFGFEEATHGALRLLSCNGNERRERPKGWNGKTLGGFENGGTIISPTCTYTVAKDITLEATLGKSWAAVSSGGIMTKSGYFLTSVVIDTKVAEFPTVTLVAEANEGADAINLWDISIPIKARAKAQNLLGAYTGGGNLNSFMLTAKAEPVVPYENNMPCASDIVHGMMIANVGLLSPSGAVSRTFASGWTMLDFPTQGQHDSYYPYNIIAERTL